MENEKFRIVELGSAEDMAFTRELLRLNQRRDLAEAWDTGLRAGLDWDNKYPGDPFKSNPYREVS